MVRVSTLSGSQYPDTLVPGWFHSHKVYEMAAARARDDSILVELGSFFGESTVYMGQLLRAADSQAKFFAIDLWCWEEWMDDTSIYQSAAKSAEHAAVKATYGPDPQRIISHYLEGNSGFVVGERGFGPATALDTVDAPILKPSAFGRGWDLGACVNGGVEGRAGDAPLPPKWLITMGLRQKNRFNECKACGCEPASNHMSGFGFSATDSDSGRRAHGSHERARSARKGRKKHVSVLPRPNRSPWIVVEQNHNGIGKLMVPAFQIYANMNVINDL